MKERDKHRPQLLEALKQTGQPTDALHHAARLEIQYLLQERDEAKKLLSEVLDAMARIGATITENVTLLRNLGAGK